MIINQSNVQLSTTFISNFCSFVTRTCDHFFIIPIRIRKLSRFKRRCIHIRNVTTLNSSNLCISEIRINRRDIFYRLRATCSERREEKLSGRLNKQRQLSLFFYLSPTSRRTPTMIRTFLLLESFVEAECLDLHRSCENFRY